MSDINLASLPQMTDDYHVIIEFSTEVLSKEAK